MPRDHKHAADAAAEKRRVMKVLARKANGSLASYRTTRWAHSRNAHGAIQTKAECFAVLLTVERHADQRVVHAPIDVLRSNRYAREQRTSKQFARHGFMAKRTAVVAAG